MRFKITTFLVKLDVDLGLIVLVRQSKKLFSRFLVEDGKVFICQFS